MFESKVKKLTKFRTNDNQHIYLRKRKENRTFYKRVKKIGYKLILYWYNNMVTDFKRCDISE